MEKESEYKLRKKLKDFEERCWELQRYREVFIDIFDLACTAAGENKNVSASWICKQGKRVFK